MRVIFFIFIYLFISTINIFFPLKVNGVALASGIGRTDSLSLSESRITPLNLWNQVKNKNISIESKRKSSFAAAKYFIKCNRQKEALNLLVLSWEYTKQIGGRRLFNDYFPALPELYWRTGDYSNALEATLNGISLAEEYKDHRSLHVFYNLMGLIYLDINDFENAKENFFKSIGWFENNKLLKSKGIVYANLGRLHLKYEKYEKALVYYRKGLSSELANKEYKAAGRSYNGLAELFWKTGWKDSAAFFLSKAIEFHHLTNDEIGFTKTFNFRGNIELEKKNYRKAIEFFTEAVSISKTTGTNKELYESYTGLWKAYEKTRQYDKSNQMLLKAFDLYKTLFNTSELVNIKKMEHRLRIKQRSNEMELEKHKTRNNFLVVIIVLISTILILIVFIFLSLRKSQHILIQKNKETFLQKEVLERLNIQLAKAKKKAEESDKLKTEFLKNISHEIRTPLNAILGFSSVIAKENISEEERFECYQIINQNNHHLLLIIENIIDLSQSMNRKPPLILKNLLLKDFFINLQIQFLQTTSIKKLDNIELIIEYPPTYPNIKVDSYKLKKIFLNLIDNAIKFTERGKIIFGCKIEDSYLSCYVKDSGCGISINNQQKIYDRFNQVKDPSQTQLRGIGIGLTLVKEYVDLFNGSIWFDSEVGKGSNFYFKIPISV